MDIHQKHLWADKLQVSVPRLRHKTHAYQQSTVTHWNLMFVMLLHLPESDIGLWKLSMYGFSRAINCPIESRNDIYSTSSFSVRGPIQLKSWWSKCEDRDSRWKTIYHQCHRHAVSWTDKREKYSFLPRIGWRFVGAELCGVCHICRITNSFETVDFWDLALSESWKVAEKRYVGQHLCVFSLITWRKVKLTSRKSCISRIYKKR